MTTINACGNGLSGSTGTGNFVGATSPTLITPNIGAAKATSVQMNAAPFLVYGTTGANAFEVTQQSSSTVNAIYVEATNTGVSPVLAAFGTDTNITLLIAGQGNGGVTIQGTQTSGNAPAGNIGEFISSVVLVGSIVPLTTNTAANVTSVSLSAGDWDVWGEVWYAGAGTTSGTLYTAQINTTSATVVVIPNANFSQVQQTSNGTIAAVGAPVVGSSVSRISIASTTTVYLIAYAAFSVSTLGAFGVLRARRVR